MSYMPNKYFILIGLILVSATSEATLITSVSVNMKGGASDSDFTNTNVDSFSAAALDGVFGSAASTAYSRYGVLKIYTSGESIGSESSDFSPNVYGYASAQFQDSMTVGNSSHNGKHGLITVAVYNEIFIDTFSNYANGTPSHARYGFDFGMQTAYAGIDSSRILMSAQSFDSINSSWTRGAYTVNDYGGSTNYGSNKNFFLITQEFVFGTPLNFYMSAWGDGTIGSDLTRGDNMTGASFVVDAGNSSYWAGIRSITVDGFAVDDYNLVSASGTDYSRSFVPFTNPPIEVPEPASLGLFSIGIAGLALFRRRARSVSGL